MAVSPFRFLHLDQLRLDSPLSDAGPVNDEIAEQLVHAPFQLLDNLLTTALEQEVDAVLITGSLFPLSPASLTTRAAFGKLADQLAEVEIQLILAPVESEWHQLDDEFKESLTACSCLTSQQPHLTCDYHEQESAQFSLINSELKITLTKDQPDSERLHEQVEHVIKLDTSCSSSYLITVHYTRSAEVESTPLFPVHQSRCQVTFKPETTLVDVLSQMQEQLEQLHWEPCETIGLIHWKATGSGPLLHSLNDLTRQQEVQKQLNSRRPLVHNWHLSPSTADLAMWSDEDELAEQFLQMLEQYKQVGHSDLIADLHSTFSENPDWNRRLSKLSEQITAEEVFNESCLQAEHFLAFPADPEVVS